MKPKVTACLAIGAWVLSACSDLTKVTNTGVVQPSAENSAAGATARAAGAAHLFYFYYALMIHTTGTFSDELIGTDFIGNSGEGFILDARRAPTKL